MKTILIIALTLSSLMSFAQNKSTKMPPDTSKSRQMNFEVKTTEAVFKGGLDSISNYVIANIDFPDAALIDQLDGKIKASFNITAEGKVKNVRILSGVGYGIDEQVVKLLQNLEYKPAEVQGTPYESQQILTIPVSYLFFNE